MMCKCLQKNDQYDERFENGDKCFLLSHFPLDSSLYDKLPLNVFAGISIVRTPKYVLCNAGGDNADLKENIALANYVYPGYGLSEGVVSVCIKIDKATPADQKDLLFWLMIGALGIVKPVFLNITGAFIYGDREGGFICHPESIQLRSNLSFDAIKQQCNFDHDFLLYNLSDLELAKKIFPKLYDIIKARDSKPRPFYNLNIFFQLAFWERLSYESSLFSKLFPFLDSFSGNPSGRQGINVPLRIANFLSDVPHVFDQKKFAKEDINNRLQHIWEFHRYPDLHGHLKLPLSKPNFTKDLFDLFEICRLCLFKMLLLSKSDFEKYSKISIPPAGLAMKEAKIPNQDRDQEANLFFANTYDNASELISFLDFTKNDLQ